ncbi:Rpn family recombination-promoting nuclease/putative transposase [Arhodomonas sp. AD133]|uniref:Rpn family recombination-promoting nuclease/putative transposase n=1 Tax=Arhodomonas sp. AD133 TaxID=3415009 RepID=UPI003EBBB797
MPDHDHSYRLLFSHPVMVADLIRGFVHEDWVAQVDFTTLERVNQSFVTDNLLDREDDIIWRVRWRGSWLYVYLLLEFQSTNDRFMAVRMLTYVGLLYQELVRGDQVTDEDTLPPVLPLVLYNGDRPWRAPTSMAELIETVPGGLEHYRPTLNYLLLDEGALDEHDLPSVRNLAAALFRLERSRGPGDLRAVITALADWLAAPEQTGLRRAFTVWIKRVLLPRRVPGAEIPEVTDLEEVNTMLSEREIDWSRDWREQGLAEGRKEGEAALLVRQMERRFGALDEATRQRIAEADAETLLLWGENILTAECVEEVFHQ